MKYVLINNSDESDKYENPNGEPLGVFDNLESIYKFVAHQYTTLINNVDNNITNIININDEEWTECEFEEEVKSYEMFSLRLYYTIYGFDDNNEKIYCKHIESFFIRHKENKIVNFRIYLKNTNDYSNLSSLVVPDYNLFY